MIVFFSIFSEESIERAISERERERTHAKQALLNKEEFIITQKDIIKDLTEQLNKERFINYASSLRILKDKRRKYVTKRLKREWSRYIFFILLYLCISFLSIVLPIYLNTARSIHIFILIIYFIITLLLSVVDKFFKSPLKHAFKFIFSKKIRRIYIRESVADFSSQNNIPVFTSHDITDTSKPTPLSSSQTTTQ